ncbi:DUF1638 domain-containing protein [Dehalococcoidia bacterium]|nr:DUF1638 domain-containing protein [Dehalococcoidia bacterium]
MPQGVGVRVPPSPDPAPTINTRGEVRGGPIEGDLSRIKACPPAAGPGEGRVLPPTCIIACGVFQPALEHLRLESKYRHLRLNFLLSNLHMRPQRLKRHLLQEILNAKERKERIICLYGECFPDIDDFCKQNGISRVSGNHCYEMLLGSERFEGIMNETAGTYFLERDLILNFEEYCIEPLELHDEEMRKYCFEHYRRVLYVRQPSDPDLVSKARELAEFLHLSLEIRDADYSHLGRELVRLVSSR